MYFDSRRNIKTYVRLLSVLILYIIKMFTNSVLLLRLLTKQTTAAPLLFYHFYTNKLYGTFCPLSIVRQYQYKYTSVSVIYLCMYRNALPAHRQGR